MPFLSIINQTIYNMDKNKIHGFMDNLNLLLIGAIIGCIIGACFMSNYHTGKGKKAEKKIEAYERYYTCVETYASIFYCIIFFSYTKGFIPCRHIGS